MNLPVNETLYLFHSSHSMKWKYLWINIMCNTHTIFPWVFHQNSLVTSVVMTNYARVGCIQECWNFRDMHLNLFLLKCTVLFIFLLYRNFLCWSHGLRHTVYCSVLQKLTNSFGYELMGFSKLANKNELGKIALPDATTTKETTQAINDNNENE